MNKVWIIIQREFITKVKKKSFILLTLLMPFIMVAIVAIPALLASVDSDESFTVGVVDKTGMYASSFKNTDNVSFVTIKDDAPIDTISNVLKTESSPYTQILYIADTLTNADDASAIIYSVDETPNVVESEVNSVLRDKIRTDRLNSFNLPNVEDIVKAADVHFNVKTLRKTDEGDKESSAEIAAVVGLMLSLFIYIFIISYGSMVMSSVMEEKTNRIVEIIVSSVKPWQLMAGKIIGCGLVGLLQMAIWGTMIVIVSTVAGTAYGITAMPEISEMAASGSAEQLAQMQQMADNPVAELLQIINGMNFTSIFIFFVLYFIGGYLLFASLFAAFGAAVNEMQDAGQFQMPVMMIFVFALYAAMFSMENPNGPLAVWCSYIPLTSPIVMMVRMPFDIPIWNVLISIGILYATAVVVILLSAKIYRIGILMYGQKPTMKDLIKWLRY
ncbi:MAG: ABC transporter permease [Bacteroidaceae bacterium]|nr:ABC transporter permease [Bacteroidaceae bacterium]